MLRTIGIDMDELFTLKFVAMLLTEFAVTTHRL